ncbi:MAG: hypothetical protein QOH31_2068 [Verrucomicrobiota bacterium]|jgi:hypothetical protein
MLAAIIVFVGIQADSSIRGMHSGLLERCDAWRRNVTEDTSRPAINVLRTKHPDHIPRAVVSKVIFESRASSRNVNASHEETYYPIGGCSQRDFQPRAGSFFSGFPGGSPID